jgi:hypothetical protein
LDLLDRRHRSTIEGEGHGPQQLPGLAVRTANLAQAREALGDTCYEEARAEGAAMSRQDALGFALLLM